MRNTAASREALLAEWLSKRPKWNGAFGGGAVCRVPGEALRIVQLAGGMKVSVLGPTPARLAALAPEWRNEVAEALRKREAAAAPAGRLEPMGPRKEPPVLAFGSIEDLRALAKKVSGKDTSRANGSSIVLLLEHAGRRVLLAGDAYAVDLVDGLRAFGAGNPVPLAAFKLPHHGSRENTTRALVDAVDCPLFLFSTDGSVFGHPDPEAVACVIEGARTRPAGLAFNARSRFTAPWDVGEWKTKLDYTTTYGNAEEGLRVAFAD